MDNCDEDLPDSILEAAAEANLELLPAISKQRLFPKAKVFNKEDIVKFMVEAPDDVYLLIKVATIFGLAGACSVELTNITLENIEVRENYITIKITHSKNRTSRAFVISEEVNNEARWQDDADGSKGLPKGVIESLRKVTPPNGMLSFERFCAGLKICLLRNQVERRPDNNGKNQEIGKVPPPINRPPSAPILDIVDNNQMSKPQWGANLNNTAAIRPNVIPPQQNVTRTLSMPQLKDPLQNEQGFEKGNNLPAVPALCKAPLYGPPKPPRTAIGMERPINPNAGGNMDRAEIRTALANWQMGLLTNQDQGNKDLKRVTNGTAAPQQGYTGLLRTSRSLGDGKAAVQGDQGQTQPGGQQIQGIYQKKPNARRREPRRHTLQNGIDYNMLKRMKQVEQEKEVLMTGLSAVEKARDWYLKQVAMVQEKMKYLGRMGHVETWSESQQERIELQRARVFEVNRHLAALTESWERGGLPLHMNLAVHHNPPHDFGERLKQQNRILTEEVNKKGERIATLEKEKASLLQVLQMRSQPARCNGNEEAVF